MADTSMVRPARADDYELFARLFLELGVDDPVPTPEHWTRQMLQTAVVAERGGLPVGYAFFQTLLDTGYIRNVVVAPEARGTGVGRALMEAMQRRFVLSGLRRWCLNVVPENRAARALYERCGLRPLHRGQVMRLGWPLVDGLPAEPGAQASSVAPRDDAAVESATGLQPGLLADARARSGRVLAQVRDAMGTIGGVAIFVPTLPGAFPFRVARPTLARPLLDGLRAHALADKPQVQLVVEDDERLHGLLRTAGARLVMELVHYRGELEATTGPAPR